MTSRRLSLTDLRALILWELEDEWVTPTEMADRLGLGHNRGWDRTALILERLANDGPAELERPGSLVRRSRSRGEAS